MEGVGVQNNKLFFSLSNIIATIMEGGILCSVVQVSAWVLVRVGMSMVQLL